MSGKNSFFKTPKFYEDGNYPKGYFDPIDPYKPVSSCPYNLLELSRYAKLHGKSIPELTKEELQQFAV